MSKVTVIIDPSKGECKYEVEGVQGASCTDLTKALTQSNEVLDSQFTSEFIEEDTLPDYCEEMADSLQDNSDE